MSNRLGFEISPVHLVSEGASFGPRIATATFRNTGWYNKPRLDVTIAADVDGNRYQDESAVRRRAGRAAVPVGRNAAQAISGGSLAPDLELVSIEPAWARASWTYAETFEGFKRRVVAIADFRAEGQLAGNLTIPPELPATVARVLKGIADALHVTIDDPQFVTIFGGR